MVVPGEDGILHHHHFQSLLQSQNNICCFSRKHIYASNTVAPVSIWTLLDIQPFKGLDFTFSAKTLNSATHFK